MPRHAGLPFHHCPRLASGSVRVWALLLVVLPVLVAGSAALGAGWLSQALLHRPLPVVWDKVKERYAHRYPSVFEPVSPLVDRYVEWLHPPPPWFTRPPPPLDHWPTGATPALALERPRYTAAGIPLPVPTIQSGITAESAMAALPPLRQRRVVTTRELLEALRTAEAGDEIELAAGTYRIQRRSIQLRAGGDRLHPIVLRAQRLGEARIELDSLEGFHVLAPYWVFENLDITGVCSQDAACEHAFHVVGKARSTVIRNTRMREFNAAVKVNGAPAGDERHYPDHGLIERSSLYNSHPRATETSVTPIDIVAADGWRVTTSLIADFAKAGGNQVSYGAFIKGNARGGTIDRNLVVCAAGVPPDPDTIRVGLSLGGGGSGGTACRDNDCTVESTDAVIRNNVIVHCSDAGIYLNRARDALVMHNTLYATWGIHARFSATRALIANNVLTGHIADRDGARSERVGNLVVGTGELFSDAANGDFSLRAPTDALANAPDPLLTVAEDVCGSPRRVPHAGAIEYQGLEPACALAPVSPP